MTVCSLLLLSSTLLLYLPFIFIPLHQQLNKGKREEVREWKERRQDIVGKAQRPVNKTKDTRR